MKYTASSLQYKLKLSQSQIKCLLHLPSSHHSQVLRQFIDSELSQSLSLSRLKSRDSRLESGVLPGHFIAMHFGWDWIGLCWIRLSLSLCLSCMILFLLVHVFWSFIFIYTSNCRVVE